MPKKRKKIKPGVKKSLVAEAGGKCANPGCTQWRTHIHHIKHWSIYQSDEPGVLIAVCPTCHDAIHHGVFEFSDQILYSWKGIKRTTKPNSTHVYIEPSSEIKILTGSIALSTTNDQATIFEITETNQLSFRILDGDIAQLNISISNLEGFQKLKVVENYVRVQDDTLKFEQVPGHIRVSSIDRRGFLSDDFLAKMRTEDSQFCLNEELTLLDILVIRPGLVKVCGCWSDSDKAVIISEKLLTFIFSTRETAQSICGEGENSVLVFTGPINQTFFGFAAVSPSVLNIPSTH